MKKKTQLYEFNGAESITNCCQIKCIFRFGHGHTYLLQKKKTHIKVQYARVVIEVNFVKKQFWNNSKSNQCFFIFGNIFHSLSHLKFATPSLTKSIQANN